MTRLYHANFLRLLCVCLGSVVPMVNAEDHDLFCCASLHRHAGRFRPPGEGMFASGAYPVAPQKFQ